VAFFAIVSNIGNGAGLQRDYELLRAMLESRGHRVHGEAHNANAPTLYSVDVVIFLEVIDSRWFGRGKEHWLVPNSEWWYDRPWARFLPQLNRVICKTHDCMNIWKRKVDPQRCSYIGWEAPDMWRPEIQREPTFLHLAGKSDTKNTMAVIEAWKRYNVKAPLTVTAANPIVRQACCFVPNVTVHDRISASEISAALNSHRFHIMPSQYEGYGMALHEGLSCGAVMITTDAPPMNECTGLQQELLVAASYRQPLQSAVANFVSPADVLAAVGKALSYDEGKIDEVYNAARAGFLHDRQQFREAFHKYMDEWENSVVPAQAPAPIQPILATRSPARTQTVYPPWFGQREK